MEEATTGIVVGFDGSDESIAALRWTLDLADRLDTTVQVVVAWRWPTSWGSHPSTHTGWSPEQDAEEIGREALAVVADGAGRSVGNGAGRSVDVSAVHGPAAEVLVAAAEHAELLVVGSRGRGGFRGMLLGSVSTACVQYATCPVVVFHDRRPATGGGA